MKETKLKQMAIDSLDKKWKRLERGTHPKRSDCFPIKDFWFDKDCDKTQKLMTLHNDFKTESVWAQKRYIQNKLRK